MEDEKTTKSKKHILNAFIALRSKKDLEKIKVVELCELAEVNKSTFYTYYHDVYDLSNQMQQEIIDRIASTLPNPEYVISNTEQFTRDVLMAYVANKEQIRTMFSGSQSYRLPMMVKDKIVNLVDRLKADETKKKEAMLAINFKLYGAYYAFLEETDMNELEKIDYISQLAGEKIVYISDNVEEK